MEIQSGAASFLLSSDRTHFPTTIAEADPFGSVSIDEVLILIESFLHSLPISCKLTSAENGDKFTSNGVSHGRNSYLITEAITSS